MATLKYLVRKDKMREDKTWNVVIRLTHDRKVRYLPTTMYATKKDLTSGFNIKNYQIIDKCELLLSEYRKKLIELDLDLFHRDIDTVVELLTRKDKATDITFSGYAEEWLSKAQIKGLKNYKTALSAFKAFLGRGVILFTDVTQNTLKSFENALSGKPRAQSMYPNCIMKIFNDARDELNNEENGLIVIRHSLHKYHAPKQNVAKKRALTLEQIRQIFALPYTRSAKDSIRDLALDCFRLSFALMGMNAVDLYNATKIENGVITYNRTKTKDRRSDMAEMQVKVHPKIQWLVDKYSGRGGHVFNFCQRYATPVNFTRALNLGLKEIGQELKIDKLQFYAARHTMATIAVNEAGVNKWLVNEMLCHVDPSMRVTDLYIKKDFAPINEANFKLLDFVFAAKAKK